jgi:proteasome lid subunit RPN8/RPN11
MTSDMQFGEVQQVEASSARRPDRNRHFAVAACGRPADDDLPIFVDLDAIREMEDHALSDTSVELGGVMLGGQHEDEDGKPFVFVTDALRAKHYKSTRGRFKFTHDTWQEITRQRDEFPEELQMVGWYHTHPGWGVFLSDLDSFICNNFFNRPLDLALVIDPCQDHRGFFQWTGGQESRTRETGGFYLVASRFRQYEVEEYAAYLGGEPAMRQEADRGYPPQRMPAPVVNISEGRPGWLAVAVVGVLVVQVMLTMLIAWRLISPPGQTAGTTDGAAPTVLEERIERLLDEQAAARRLAIKEEVLDEVVGQIADSPERVVSALSEARADNDRLRSGYDAMSAKNKQLETNLNQTEKDRTKLEKDLKRISERLEKIDREQKGTIREQDKEIASLEREIRELKGPEDAADSEEDGDGDAEGGWFSNTWIVTLISAGVLTLVAVFVVLATSRRGRTDEDDEGFADESSSADSQTAVDDDQAIGPPRED